MQRHVEEEGPLLLGRDPGLRSVVALIIGPGILRDHKSGGCSTVVERTPCDLELVGSYCWAFFLLYFIIFLSELDPSSLLK